MPILDINDIIHLKAVLFHKFGTLNCVVYFSLQYTADVMSRSFTGIYKHLIQKVKVQSKQTRSLAISPHVTLSKALALLTTYSHTHIHETRLQSYCDNSVAY